MADETYSSDPQAVDPYSDHAAILDLVKTTREEFSKGRERFLLPTQRNIRYARGQQWDIYDRRFGRWRPRTLTRGTPTPVTNIFAANLRAIIAVFARVEPLLTFRPGSPEEPDDRAAADVASRAIEVIEAECNIRMLRQQLANWVGYAGGAWVETGYDADPAHGTREMEVEKCQACGYMRAPEPAPEMDPMMAPTQPMCPECGSPMMPSVEQFPVGKMYADIVPMNEMYFDAAITDWEKHRKVIRAKSVPLDHAKERWPHIAENLTANILSGVDEMISESLPSIAPQLDDQQSRWLYANQRQTNSRVSEEWFYHVPCEKYPQGLLAVIVGKEHVAYAKPLPYTMLMEDGTEKPFINLTWFPQEQVPGTFFPKTVADDLALVQDQRNRWESIVIACGMRMGSPVWLKPAGSNVRNLTGEPGQVIEYAPNPQHANIKPERIQGQGIPLSFIQRIEMLDKDAEQVGATFDVIKGARPEGVSAGIALQILQERGMSRFAPLFIQWEASWAAWARQAIEIFRKYVSEERIRKIKGRDGGWEVQKFIGADLQGRVDVIPEAGSSMPRSTMVQRAEFEQAVALGLLPIGDPEVRFKGLELYGLTHMVPNLKADTKNAFMENEAYAQLAQEQWVGMAAPEDTQFVRMAPDNLGVVASLEMRGIKVPRVRPAIDDHAVHMREHKVFAKSESFQQLPEMVQALLEKHIQEHEMLLIQQMIAMKGAAPQGDAKAGFLGQPPARVQEMNTSSSGQRLGGEMNEMERSYTDASTQ